MKKGKLLSLLLAAAVGAGSLAMTAQAAPAAVSYTHLDVYKRQDMC